MLVFIEVFLDHLDEILNPEGFGHELVTPSHLGLTDILVESIGAEGDNGGIVVDFLDDSCGVEPIHFRHANVHQDQVWVLVLIQVDSLDTVRFWSTIFTNS